MCIYEHVWFPWVSGVGLGFSGSEASDFMPGATSYLWHFYSTSPGQIISSLSQMLPAAPSAHSMNSDLEFRILRSLMSPQSSSQRHLLFHFIHIPLYFPTATLSSSVSVSSTKPFLSTRSHYATQTGWAHGSLALASSVGREVMPRTAAVTRFKIQPKKWNTHSWSLHLYPQLQRNRSPKLLSVGSWRSKMSLINTM